MVELEGWSGLFSPDAFVVVDDGGLGVHGAL
jgi:hypothetical protein